MFLLILGYSRLYQRYEDQFHWFRIIFPMCKPFWCLQSIFLHIRHNSQTVRWAFFVLDKCLYLRAGLLLLKQQTNRLLRFEFLSCDKKKKLKYLSYYSLWYSTEYALKYVYILCTHADSFTHTVTHTHTHTHTQTHAVTHPRIHTHTRTRTRIHIKAGTLVCVNFLYIYIYRIK